jgi:hypothetical protein
MKAYRSTYSNVVCVVFSPEQTNSGATIIMPCKRALAYFYASRSVRNSGSSGLKPALLSFRHLLRGLAPQCKHTEYFCDYHQWVFCLESSAIGNSLFSGLTKNSGSDKPSSLALAELQHSTFCNPTSRQKNVQKGELMNKFYVWNASCALRLSWHISFL